MVFFSSQYYDFHRVQRFLMTLPGMGFGSEEAGRITQLGSVTRFRLGGLVSTGSPDDFQ